MLSSLASNNIQAAVLTSFGLSAITPAVMTLSVPFMIRDDTELDMALKEVQGDLERQMGASDYFVIAWSKAGWVNIFSKDPVFVPDDLRKMKVATNGSSDDINTAFRAMGFQLVETDLTDVGTKMMSGAVNAVYQSPAAVAAYRLHEILKNMASINIAPFMGGIVMNRVTWEKLNPRYRDELVRATRRIAADLDASMQNTVSYALTVMTRDGLKMNKLNSAQETVWYTDVERVIPSLLGTTFDRDIYEKINKLLKNYRSGR
jgi:TRAP-type C4-dicarboxylate transport system substrate-binding protein